MRALVFTLILLSACAPDYVAKGRPFTVQVPAGADGPLPLVILAHGYGVDGVVQDLVLPFSKQVEARKFLYALPNGTQDRLGRRFWNATDACCNFDDIPVDDVGFFRALIDEVKSRHPVSKVFVVGHSNGAFMSLRLACEASDVIDGIVSVAGSAWYDFATKCPEGRAIPVLLVHGRDDTVIPYDGKAGRYPGAHETGRRYARRNGCAGDWEELERGDFEGPPETETMRERFADCPAGASVELWSMDGTGHVPSVDARWTTASLDWLEENAR